MEKKSYTIPVLIGIIILGIVVFILWNNSAPLTTPAEPLPATSNPSDTAPAIDNSTTSSTSPNSEDTASNPSQPGTATDIGNASSATPDKTPVAPTSITIPLASENKSKEEGSATITKMGNKIKVTLTVTGAPKGSLQPAHIHSGSCDKPGAIKYPLADLMNGASEKTVNVSYEQLISELPLSINVHKSIKDIKTYVACGNVTVTQE